MADYTYRKSQILPPLGQIQISITCLNLQQIWKSQYFSSITEKTSGYHMNNSNTLSHYGNMMTGGFFLKMQKGCSSNTQVQHMHCTVISLLISRSSCKVQNKRTCKFLVALQSYQPIIEVAQMTFRKWTWAVQMFEIPWKLSLHLTQAAKLECSRWNFVSFC